MHARFCHSPFVHIYACNMHENVCQDSKRAVKAEPKHHAKVKERALQTVKEMNEKQFAEGKAEILKACI